MKLLLDEHYAPEIARQLRARGHDELAVGERPELVSRSDRLHFAAMAAERRAIATEDVGDFRPLESVDLLALGPAVLRAARTIAPGSLRALDAIHLASALELGDDLDVFVVYDPRLADAASAAGLTVPVPA